MSKIRPELNNDAKFVVDTFLERGLFRTQSEVITAALELLFEKQMELDVVKQSQNRADYSDLFKAQLVVDSAESKIKVG